MTAFDLDRLLAEIAAATEAGDVVNLVLRDCDAIEALPEREREYANARIADAIRERS